MLPTNYAKHSQSSAATRLKREGKR